MKLAELEAKAKALAGAQHWRGLDPEAVLGALAEIKRLRSENAVLKKHLDLYEASDNLVIKNEDEIENEQWQFAEEEREKLAKARAAVK